MTGRKAVPHIIPEVEGDNIRVECKNPANGKDAIIIASRTTGEKHFVENVAQGDRAWRWLTAAIGKVRGRDFENRVTQEEYEKKQRAAAEAQDGLPSLDALPSKPIKITLDLGDEEGEK